MPHSAPPTANIRIPHASRTPHSPPAVWAAFARQGAWKNWVILGQFVLLFILVLGSMGLATRPPDIVVVDSTSGKSTYLNASIAGAELQRFLAEQKQRPSDVTVAHFTKDFLKALLASNSASIGEDWDYALSVVEPALRAEMEKVDAKDKYVEKVRAARTRGTLAFEQLQLVNQQATAVEVRARVRRDLEPLLGGAAKVDRLEITLVERVVPRTLAHPDGLVVSLYQTKVMDNSSRISSEDVAHDH